MVCCNIAIWDLSDRRAKSLTLIHSYSNWLYLGYMNHNNVITFQNWNICIKCYISPFYKQHCHKNYTLSPIWLCHFFKTNSTPTPPPYWVILKTYRKNSSENIKPSKTCQNSFVSCLKHQKRIIFVRFGFCGNFFQGGPPPPSGIVLRTENFLTSLLLSKIYRKHLERHQLLNQ